jgi:uncharacterized protein YnzC (UPF0291/DUF896 family)
MSKPDEVWLVLINLVSPEKATELTTDGTRHGGLIRSRWLEQWKEEVRRSKETICTGGDRGQDIQAARHDMASHSKFR